MNTATLWYVEYCSNRLGVWDRRWFTSKAEAEEGYYEACEYHGREPFDPEFVPTGEYGDVCEPEPVEVELTAQGVLDFARRFAVDED